MSVKVNIAANYVASAWNALAALVFAPVFLNLLGVEAYGLIGTFVLLQATLALMDMGLSPTLVRFMSLFRAGNLTAEGIRDLLRSIEWVIAAAAIAIAAGLAIAANWLSIHWLHPEHIARAEVAGSLSIMGLVLALRLFENIYRSALNGLEAQVSVAALTIATTTLRTAGAAVVLVVFGATIATFFWWQLGVAAASLVATGLVLYRRLPRVGRTPQFSLSALADVRSFAGGMVGITIMSLLLMQVDKVILLAQRPLADYGVYALAVAGAGAILVPIAPIAQALLPRWSAMVARHETGNLAPLYLDASRVVSSLVASLAFVLIAFAHPILTLWMHNPAVAADAAPLLRVYVLGTMFQAMTTMPFTLQLAHGWTRLAFSLTTIALVGSSVALAWAIPRYGALGACWVWAGLNLGTLLVMPIIMHRRMMPGLVAIWFGRAVALPLLIAGGVVGVASLLGTPSGVPATVGLVGVATLSSLAATLMVVPVVRRLVVERLSSDWSATWRHRAKLATRS